MIGGPLMVAAARNLETIATRHRHERSAVQTAEFIMVLDGFRDESNPAQEEEGENHTGEEIPTQAHGETLPQPMLAVINLRSPEPQGGALQNPSEPPAAGNQPSPKVVVARPENAISFNLLALPEGTAALTGAPGDEKGAISLPADGGTGDEMKRASIQMMTDAPLGDQESPAPSASPMRGDSKERERDIMLTPAAIKDAEVAAYPSPAVQIISQINAAVAEGQVQATALSATQQAQFADPALPSPSEVKALRLKLQPEELGDVEVTIRRAGLHTMVTITVTDQAAMEAISKDKGFLEERLGSLLTPGASNTVMVSMEIRDAGPAPDQGPQTGGGQGSSEAAPGGRGSGRNGRPDHHEHSAGMTGDEHETDDRILRVAAGSGRIV
jgi:hypothetical protein